MIFRQIAEITDGAKTQTRRVSKGEGLSYTHSPAHITRIKDVFAKGRMKWRVSNTYAIVPKRGVKGVGFIRLTGIRQERLHEITEADAQAEGITAVPLSRTLAPAWQTSVLPGQTFPTARACYEALWRSINTAKNTRWEDNPLVWVLTFVYVGIDKKR